MARIEFRGTEQRKLSARTGSDFLAGKLLDEDGVCAFGGSGFGEILRSVAFAVKLGEAGGEGCELKAACAAVTKAGKQFTRGIGE